MNLLHQNNAAVSLLTHEDGQSAIELLRATLSPLLRSELNARRNHHNKNYQEPVEETSHGQNSFQLLHLQDVEIFQTQKDPSVSFLFYNRAFFMMSSKMYSPSVCAAIMSYNLGLAYHQQGILSGEHAVLASKAFTMYKLSLQLFREIIVGNEEENAILLALLNNMGDIQARLGHHDEARSLFEEMQFVLSFLCDIDERNRERFAFFSLNLMCQRATSGSSGVYGGPAPAA